MGPKRSAYRGVCWDKQPGKWKAQIKEPVTKRVKHLGLFVIEDEAAQAYDDAERSMRGANAELNFPGPGEKQAKPRTTRTKEEAEAAKLLPKQKSSHRGVTWDAARGKWKVAINPQNGKKSQFGLHNISTVRSPSYWVYKSTHEQFGRVRGFHRRPAGGKEESV